MSEISLHKTIHMISTGDPPLTCSCYNIGETEWTITKRLNEHRTESSPEGHHLGEHKHRLQKEINILDKDSI